MSNSFKTKAGTELPLLDLRGKKYLQVAHRLVWFREEHPEWGIITEIIDRSEIHALVRAVIRDESGNIVSSAHKFEDKRGFADFIEKAETGAIGRALAGCGYGTQFAPELEEEHRIVDSPVQRANQSHAPAPRKEVAPPQRSQQVQPVPRTSRFPAYPGKRGEAGADLTGAAISSAQAPASSPHLKGAPLEKP
jgi:hypothetical protein